MEGLQNQVKSSPAPNGIAHHFRSNGKRVRQVRHMNRRRTNDSTLRPGAFWDQRGERGRRECDQCVEHGVEGKPTSVMNLGEFSHPTSNQFDEKAVSPKSQPIEKTCPPVPNDEPTSRPRFVGPRSPTATRQRPKPVRRPGASRPEVSPFWDCSGGVQRQLGGWFWDLARFFRHACPMKTTYTYYIVCFHLGTNPYVSRPVCLVQHQSRLTREVWCVW